MLPPSIIIPYYSTHASIPADWTRKTEFDGKYVKAATASLGTTGGASTHSHTSSSHTHTYTGNGHTHTTPDITGAGTHKSDGQHQDSPPHDVLTTAHAHNGVTTGAMTSASITAATPTIGTGSNEVNRLHFIFITTTKYKPYPTNGIILRDDTAARVNATHLDAADGRYLKGAAAGADAGSPADTANHNHTQSHTHTLSHTHNVSGQAYSKSGKLGGKDVSDAIGDHDHVVYTDAHNENVSNATALSTYAHDLAYKELHFWQSSVVQVPRVGDIALTLGTIPIGYQDAGLNNVYVKGKATGGSPTTGGSLTHTHDSISHGHTGSSHVHTFYTSTASNMKAYRNGGSATLAGAHNHTGTTNAGTNDSAASSSMSFSTSNNEPPYILARFIKMQFSPIKQAPLMLLL